MFMCTHVQSVNAPIFSYPEATHIPTPTLTPTTIPTITPNPIARFIALKKHEARLTGLFDIEFAANPVKRRKVNDSIKTKLYFARTEADILQLIEDSADKPRTKQYDWYQWKTNGIAI